MISAQILESLGEKRFEIPKSKWRLAFWSALIVLAALGLYLLAQKRSLTVNELLLLAWLAVAQILFIVEYFRSRIDVYSNGIVRRRLFGQAYVFVFNPYMQVFVMRRSLGLWHWRVGRQTSVRLRDEMHEYRLPFSFSRNEEVVAEIENYLFRESMHMLNQLYDSGETLDFGAVQLNRNHIAVSGKYLLRNEFGKIDVRRGHLRIYGKNEKGKIKLLAFSKTPLHQIANFRLLCRFVEFNDVDVQAYAYRVYGMPFLIK
ncbi:DUF6585 family protein [Alysiella filiformis]|uniref:Uncharacterized protein n=1 Tax=Alysiella filiformis DSM 16848 TaxID=1120981 RepID=A0A286E3L7_9NEIS|nr:DUF6585 family protein [Alysiella filiformis]QMT31074.1 hypothetical protein H3L97_10185 [Alysiella filiformis]UBQ55935.1 hypothetical protein JF568_10285 [Alysiella filiformis DSM 16848]SOD65496.1 hypothetical protein SAMN02746062_00311 [Alysiella filiformis DSM 16848]